MNKNLMAGAATADITPKESLQLMGYPHCDRYATGAHDPLLSTAICLDDGETVLLLIANDNIFVPKALAAAARKRIEAATGIPGSNILIAATHTHSGPAAASRLYISTDPAWGKPVDAFMAQYEDGIVAAAVAAFDQRRPAEIGLSIADATGVGTNRRDPAGPTDPEVPVLAVRDADNGGLIGIMAVYGMHPTVLHEDSLLYSADFPGMCRQYLQSCVVGTECPVAYFTGPAGNQSPRHVTQGNTFAEAERLGQMLGGAVEKALQTIAFQREVDLGALQAEVELVPREFPSVEEAERSEQEKRARLETLRASGSRQEARTAECDWFGAENTYRLAKIAQEEGGAVLRQAIKERSPGEVQLIRVGPWRFVGWPGEIFVEFSLQVKAEFSNTFVIAYANGETHSYLVTQEAVDGGGYESSSAIFKSPDSANLLVETTRDLINRS